MTSQNPATPAQAATPGTGEPVATPPAGSTPPGTQNGAGGNNQAGVVTISVEEFNNLQRDAARGRSPKAQVAPRTYQRPSQAPASVDQNDPVAVANAARIEAEQKAMRLEVQGKVRDLLADDRFKNIPQSTKKIILDAPHALTQAETLDEAMYDIEDRLIELSQADGIPVTVVPQNNNAQPQNAQPQTPSRETPPVVTPGSPAPVDAGALEDTSNLRGVERSVATIRNAFKKQGIGGGRTQ